MGMLRNRIVMVVTGSPGGPSRPLVAPVALAALVLLTASCATGDASGGASDRPPRADPAAERHDDRLVDPDPETGLALRNFPTTPDGLTYGSDAEADTPADAPDLIAVVATNGRPGFVAKADLYDDHGVETPADARRYEERIADGWSPPPLEVRDLSGNRVGEFVLVDGEVTR